MVTVSVFELFRIGIGPSSSHTVGPMRAARRYVTSLVTDGLLDQVTRVQAQLFGSLGATGHGNGSENAVLWGLEGADQADPPHPPGGSTGDRVRPRRGCDLAPAPFASVPSQRHDVHRVRRRSTAR